MKKADLKVDTEYYVASGRSYRYGEKRVVVDGIGARSNSFVAAQRDAQYKVGLTHEKLRELRNDPDLSENQVKAAIAELEAAATKEARKGFKPFTVNGKGGGILVTVLNKETGKPEKKRVMQGSGWVVTDQDERMVIESREFVCTWAQHEKDVREAAEYAEKQAAERAAANEQKAAEVAALTAALPEGVTFGASAHGESTIELDRGYGWSAMQVAMSRATLAQLLGIELPGQKEVTD